jgi:hypothetical protein
MAAYLLGPVFLDRAATKSKNLSCLLADEVPDSIPSLGLPILGWIDGFTGAYAFVTLAA